MKTQRRETKEGKKSFGNGDYSRPNASNYYTTHLDGNYRFDREVASAMFVN